MPKWSDYIRNLGTAGPATLQGIKNLGFLLASDIPALVGEYVRVDQAQAFTDPQKTQGRANIGAVIGTDVQAFSTSLTSLAGVTTAADSLPYATAADTWAVTTLTAFARTILDDVDAPAVRTTLGLGTVATQAASSVAITGGSITGITDIAIADGGTGGSTPAAARTNLELGTAATVNTGVASGEIPLLQTGGVLAPARLGTGAPSAANFLRGDGAWSTVDVPTVGTFTPGIAFGGAAVGVTYATQIGRYMRIGTRVLFSSRVTISNAGSSTGALTITGLPFAAAAFDAAISVGLANNFASLTGVLGGFVQSSTSTISIRQSSSTGSAATVTQSNVTNTADIIISGVYETV